MANLSEIASGLSSSKRQLLAQLLKQEAARRPQEGQPVPPLAPIPRGGPLPLSFAQQRLWFLHQLNPHQSSYHLSGALRLKGQLDVAALERTLNEIVRRHETLRTTFAVIGDAPAQVVASWQPVSLPVTDLREVPPSEIEQRIQCLIDEDARRPFDLAEGPLLRARLLRTGEREHALSFTMHHIISDGWSLDLLVRELGALYEAFSKGEPSPLPELTIQYADYAAWQRAWLTGKTLERQLDYWKQRLAEAPLLLELPADHPRPPAQSFRGAYERFALTAEISESLRQLSRKRGVTLFMTLLAAFKTLLHRYTGQTDIVVGTPSANRDRVEIEQLIGFFVNTLALRTAAPGDITFHELLARVRETALAAYAHLDLPFEKLVEELQPERDMSRSPIFQVMFDLRHAPQMELNLPGLSLSHLGVAGDAAKFDLSVLMIEGADGELSGTFEYSVDLFEAATVRRMARHFQTLLAGIATRPEGRLDDLPWLTESERRQILIEWNRTQKDYDLNRCLHQLIEERVALAPEAVAVEFGAESLSYRALNQRANQLAHYLRSLGAGPDTLVGVCLERSPDLVIALLAALKAGAAYIPLDPSYPPQRLNFMLADSAALALLTGADLRGRLPQSEAEVICPEVICPEVICPEVICPEVICPEVICLDNCWETIAQEPDHNPQSHIDPDNLAYVIYTSGSTGRPKGAMNIHRGVVNRLLWMQDEYLLTADDRVLQKTPYSFDVSVWEFFWPLIAGARLVVAEPGGHQDPAYLVEAIRTHKITTLHFVPSMLEAFLSVAGVEECQSARRVISSGEALTPHLVERFYERLGRAELHNLYGPTEAAIDVTSWACERGAIQHLVPIGRPIANISAYVLDGRLEPAPVGVPGELHIAGVGVGRGYLKGAEMTAERFAPHPFSALPGQRLYKTGDRARLGADGSLVFLGRSDHQVKLRGFRIELGEIEAALGSHPALRQCAVVVNKDGDEGAAKRLVAYVVAGEGATVGAAALREHVRDRLPEYMAPSAYVMVEQLPQTASGKVDRGRLVELAEMSAAPGTESMKPRTEIEELLAGIWAEVLKVEAVGVEDNFFDLGGHSLLATQVVSRIGQVFGIEVPLRNMFERPTISGLGKEIEAQQRAGGAISAPPLSFAQERLWFLDQLVPGNAFYNMSGGLRLKGELNFDAMERTFAEITRRHETLRTTFAVKDGKPVQVIASDSSFHLPVEDLREFAESERETSARQSAREEAMRPFDLARGPLMRARLLRLAEDEHVLLVTMHHIISDGWSLGVLAREIAAIYTAFSQGNQSPLAEAPIQYADYAIWQRERLTGSSLERQIAYWESELAGAPALEFPTDRPRPAAPTYHGAHQPIVISKETTEALKKLGRQESATLFMTLLAAFSVALSRYSRQDDIVIGSPIANRTRAEVEGLIGFFVNMQVLRTRLSGDPSFRELLPRVREVCLGAYANQDMPFETLVDELRPERRLNVSPLFQTTFALQNAPAEEAHLPGLTLNALDFDRETTRFDLELQLWERPRGLEGFFCYSVELFDAETIESLAERFNVLLEGIVANPARKISELPLLTETERQKVIESGRAVARYAKDKCLHEQFESQVERAPERIAVKFETQSLSYRELNARANQIAHYLQRLGVGPESRVGVFLDRSPEMVVGLLGILKAGAAYAPLDPAYPPERLGFILADAEVKVLLTQQSLADRLPDTSARIVCVDAMAETLAAESDRNPPQVVIPENPAYVIYTSGSTGAPKGVLVTHANVARLFTATETWFGFSQDDAWTLFHSYAFDFSVWELWGALLYGGRLITVPYFVSRSPEAFYDLLCDEEITVLNQTPSAFHQLMRVDGARRSGARSKRLALRVVIFGGEALDIQSLRPWIERHGVERPRLVNMYGITETTVHVTYRPLALEDTEGRRGSQIGRAIPDLDLYVLDDCLQPAPMGLPGEIYVGGEGLARAYLRRAELTAERFIPHPYSAQAGARLYRTGDLARRSTGGELEFLGRADDQIKIRGFRIEPGEIEAALTEHAALREAIVIAREDTPGDKRLVAYVTQNSLFQTAQGPDYGARQAEQVAQWQSVFDDTYNRPAPQASDFNIAGWNSSYTNQPIPPEEMREWVEETVQHILSLNPDRALEIGCGTGLLLLRLASHCRRYCGTDFSRQALDYLRGQLQDRPERSRVTLRERPADDFSEFGAETFDAVILNSVVQYFPSLDYLLRALEGAFNVLRPGGFIYVGDVRSLPLLRAFHTSVELSRAEPSLPIGRLRQRVDAQIAQESELLLDPRFFLAIKERWPRIGRVEITPKRGRFANELTQFRYQVVIHDRRWDGRWDGKRQEPAPESQWLRWRQDGLDSLDALRRRLEAGAELGVRNIPNARLTTALRAVEALNGSGRFATAGELREFLSNAPEEGIDPEQLFGMGLELPYRVALSWADHGADGRFDVAFKRMASGPETPHEPPALEAPTHRPWSHYANDPLQGAFARQLAPELRQYLREKLPEHMIPAAFVLLESMPLTPHGKVDRRALPAPEFLRPELNKGYLAPRTPTEGALAAIWREALGVDRIGVDDNFFDLGGHSLLATHVISLAREKFHIDIALRSLFESPTVAGLAAQIEQAKAGKARSEEPPIRPVSRQREAPLSFAQQRLWFLDQLEPDNPFYNIAAATRLSGRLDVTALERSIGEIIRRHEALRTTFATVDGQPAQIVAPWRPFTLHITHLSGPATRDAEVRRMAAEEGARPFNLSRGPLFRASLLRLAEHEHVLLLTMHHIVGDGWSIGVFIRELAALYEAWSQGRPSPLAELPIQYADYAVWQRERMAGELLDRSLSYWKKQLAGAQVLEAPTDRPRPAAQTHRGSQLFFELTAELTHALHQLSNREGATLYMTLLAAFQTLLMRYCRQTDISVGSPIANRTRAELEPLIGFFVNTLILRTDLSGNPSFRQALRRAREACLEAYEHQDLPFEKLVEELQPERSLSHSPLFQVMFILQNAPMPELKLGEARLSSLEAAPQTAKFDLTMEMAEAEGRLIGWVEYNTDLFNAETINRLTRHYQKLLESVVADAETPVSDLEMLGEEERRQILIEWNSTTGEYPRELCVNQLFEVQASRTPDAVAIVCEDESVTYAELDRRANQLARHLRRHGVGPEARVGLMLERSVGMMVGLLGILKAGGAYAPLDPGYPHRRLAFMMEAAQISALITDGPPDERMQWPGTKAIGLDTDWERVAEETAEPPGITALPENPAYVLFTSGSTGNPKGVAMPHRALTNLIWWQLRDSGFGPGQRTLQFAPLSFDVSFQEIFSTWLAGGTLVLVAEEKRRDGATLWEVLRERKITRLFLPFVALGQLAETFGLDETWASPASLPGLREIITAGEQLQVTPSLVRMLSNLKECALSNQYGPTESHVVTAHTLSKEAREWPPLPPIGRPVTNAQIYLLDDRLHPVPIGVAGEIYIGGVCLARGYMDAGMTAERFLPHPFSAIPGQRIYKTGDHARLLGDGSLAFLGRSDQQVKLRGFRIELGEIEAALSSHPAVRQCAVVVNKDGGEGAAKRLVAYVVAGEGVAVEAAALREHARDRLPEYMAPSVYVVVEQLPKTASGKVDRRRLAEMTGENAPAKPKGVKPRTEVEELLAGIWKEVLKVEAVGVEDNFFDLGGHSLLATQLISRVRDVFKMKLPLRKLFEAPTIAEMAQAVAQSRQELPLADKIEPIEETEDELLAMIDQLSSEEVEALLMRALSETEADT